MQVSRLFRKLMDQAGDGTGGEGGAGGSGGDDIQARIDKAIGEATSGLVAKNKELLGKLHTQSEALKAWDGMDPASIRTLMERMDGDEELKLLKDGKLEDVVTRRVAKRDADWQKKLDAAMALADGEKAKNQKFLGRVLDEQIRASVSGKVHDKAVEDALFRARMLFTLDEDGNAVQIQDGKPVVGKDGKTPFSPAEWIESMRENAPHWFPATGSGSGAQHSTSTGGSKTISRAKYEALSPAEQRSTVNSGVTVVD